MLEPIQFGNPVGEYCLKQSAYAVVVSDEKLLCLFVRGKYHLPGGGIEQGEDVAGALRREVLEEAGYQIMDLQEIGKANQFFETTREGGSLNKLGTFFKAAVDLISVVKGKESDHEPKWITVEEFLSSTAADFQKWAVKQVV